MAQVLPSDLAGNGEGSTSGAVKRPMGWQWGGSGMWMLSGAGSRFCARKCVLSHSIGRLLACFS